ncbi:(Fe-S)-binding protein [Spirochaetia bacterium]|nr:(Fe-S)-binding protein [Spirochaetia bacterium]
MKRKIIKIDDQKCNGCGLCITACHEGAIGIVDGKACLIKDDYCDGLGNCLPVCPVDAISFEEREAVPFDEKAAVQHKQTNADSFDQMTRLANWPIQIKNAPSNAACFDKADLLVSADCCAYAYNNFHKEFMKNKTVLIGCPKLDSVDYSEKITSIIKENNIASVTVARMEVPCCAGIENAVKTALAASGKTLPCTAVIFSIDGKHNLPGG